MSTIPYKLSGARSLVHFTLTILLLLVSLAVPTATSARVKPNTPAAPRPEAKAASGRPSLTRRARGFNPVGARSAAQIRIPGPPIPKRGGGKVSVGDMAKSSVGPLIAFTSLSNFSFRGPVQGNGWIVVLYYELEPESVAEVTITAEGVKQPLVIRLAPTNDGPAEVIHELPREFGDKPRVGVLNFQAYKTGPGERRSAFFFLHELGVGEKPNVYGSRVIDQMRFRPSSIRPGLKEKATYSFLSLSDFDTVSAEFARVTLAPDGVFRPVLIDREMLKRGVRRGETVAREWDGKDSKGKISKGPHQFHVRVWRGLKRGGDWVFAATRQMVKVEQ
ncbi:MAG TPA: hypothetical protein VFZ44_11560 [Pyrinomonadaceae bacterium]